MRNEFAPVGGVNALLDKGQEIGLRLGGPLHGLRHKPGAAAALCRDKLVDQGQCFRVDPCGDDCGLAHESNVSFVYI